MFELLSVGKYYIGEFSRTDVPNRNGIIFPHEVMKKAVDEYNKNEVNVGTFESAYDAGYNLEDISHIIEYISETKTGFSATIRIIDTPRGKLLLEAMNLTEVEFNGVYSGIVDKNKNVSKCSIISIDTVLPN